MQFGETTVANARLGATQDPGEMHDVSLTLFNCYPSFRTMRGFAEEPMLAPFVSELLSQAPRPDDIRFLAKRAVGVTDADAMRLLADAPPTVRRLPYGEHAVETQGASFKIKDEFDLAAKPITATLPAPKLAELNRLAGETLNPEDLERVFASSPATTLTRLEALTEFTKRIGLIAGTSEINTSSANVQGITPWRWSQWLRDPARLSAFSDDEHIPLLLRVANVFGLSLPDVLIESRDGSKVSLHDHAMQLGLPRYPSASSGLYAKQFAELASADTTVEQKLQHLEALTRGFGFDGKRASDPLAFVDFIGTHREHVRGPLSRIDYAALDETQQARVRKVLTNSIHRGVATVMQGLFTTGAQEVVKNFFHPDSVYIDMRKWIDVGNRLGALPAEKRRAVLESLQQSRAPQRGR